MSTTRRKGVSTAAAPAPEPHATTHEPAGIDEVNDIDIGNTGVLLSAHATRHQSGGADETRNIEWLTGLADLGYSGDVSLVTVGEIVLAGDGLFLQNDGEYYKSDADAAATMPVKVMALAGAAAHATVLVLHDGYYRNDDLYDWTPGAGVANLLFADVNAGLFVQFAGKPAGAGDQVQVVGWIVNANQICFRPSLELVEVA